MQARTAVPSWQPLMKGLYALDPRVPGTDPMWIWADATHYREHRPIDLQLGVPAVVDHGAAHTLGMRFEGSHLTADQLRALVRAGLRVELAMPVVPLRPQPVTRAGDAALPLKPAPVSNKKLLVAVIDSGCPFASRMLRDASGGTRVLALWDQDPNPSFARCGGYRPQGPGYGAAVGRDELDALLRRTAAPLAPTGGRDPPAVASDFGRTIDEALCYRLADYDAMKPHASHGAAVLSQLLATPIRGGALEASAQARRSRDAAGTLPIDEADVVFVQLPRDAVQDSTSAGLARNVVDGLRFVLDRADPKVTQRIVVTISNGTSRTTHDGTSIVEQSLVAWIDEARQRGIDATVVLPIGNTHEEQRHAVLARDDHALELMVPPDCEMPQYVTVRCPPDAIDKVVLRVTPPGGEASSVACGQARGWPNAGAPACGVVWPQPPQGLAGCALIAIAPTKVSAMQSMAAAGSVTPAARNGRWRIQIAAADGTPLRLDEPVAFWVSRNQRNPGALPRSRQACFFDNDETHQPKRWLRSKPNRPDSWRHNGVRRAGALSGLATIAHPKIIVVGGYVLGAGTPPPACDYSAAGPAAGTDPHRRTGPDLSAPADANRALPGLSVRANLSGGVIRMRGTSFAAPLVARAIVNVPPAGGASGVKKTTARVGRFVR